MVWLALLTTAKLLTLLFTSNTAGTSSAARCGTRASAVIIGRLPHALLPRARTTSTSTLRL